MKEKYQTLAFEMIVQKLQPCSPSDLVKLTKCEYSRAHDAFSELSKEGLIQCVGRERSKKGVKGAPKVRYCLTFKGTLKYLAGFNQQVVDGTLDETKKKELLLFIKQQGEQLNYPPFQFCYLLCEKEEFTLNQFIGHANLQVKKPLADDAALAEAYCNANRQVMDNSEFFAFEHPRQITDQDILLARKGENQNLMVDFGREWLIWGLGRVSKLPNKKLHDFAKCILEDTAWQVGRLQDAVDIFSEEKLG